MWTSDQKLGDTEPMALQLIRTGNHIGDIRHLMLRVLMEVVEPFLTFPSQTFVRWRFLPLSAEAVLHRFTDCKQRAFHQTTAQSSQIKSKGKAKTWINAAAEIKKVKDMSRNGRHIHDAMSKFLGSGLTPDLVFMMLKTLRYDADTAYFFFKWAGEQAGYQHESRHYDFIVQVLAAASRFNDLEEVLSEMDCQKLGFEACLALAVSYANTGHVEKALTVFYQLRSRGYTMPAHVYNSIFTALDRLKLYQQAFQIVDDLIASGFVPRESTSDILLRMFCRAGALDMAVSLLRKLCQKPAQVNPMALSMVVDNLCRVGRSDMAIVVYEEATVTSSLAIADTGFVFGSLVCGIFRTGKLDTVSLIIRKLMQRGLTRQFTEFPFQEGARPYLVTQVADMMKRSGFMNTFAYNCLIEGLCKAAKLEDAQQIFDDMLFNKVPTDVFTFSTIIDGICKAGRVEEAEKLLESMENSECKPDVVAYTNLVIGFCGAGRFEHVFMTLQRMKDAGCQPDVVIYNAVVNGLCKSFQFDEALKLVTEMIQTGWEPDEVTYSTIIDALCKHEDWSQALNVFETMRNRGCRASVDLYGRLVHCLSKTGNIQGASSLLEDMLTGEKRSGLVLGGEPCKPNLIIYNTVISGLCDNDRLNDAFVVLKILQDEGFEPDAITYTSFILAYCKTKKIDKALAILEVMVKAGCKPDSVTYNTIFLGLCFVGREDEACGIFQEMLNTGCQPDLFTFKIHIETLCRRKMLEAAVCILDFMKAMGLGPDMGIFKNLIYAHYELGRSDEARQILQREERAFSWKNQASLVAELHEASTPYEQTLLEKILRNGI